MKRATLKKRQAAIVQRWAASKKLSEAGVSIKLPKARDNGTASTEQLNSCKIFKVSRFLVVSKVQMSSRIDKPDCIAK